MLRIEKKSKRKPAEITGRLKSFFGKGGLGLELIEESTNCLNFEGGGGYVTATVCPDQNLTRVEFLTQEWDYQVKKFLTHLC